MGPSRELIPLSRIAAISINVSKSVQSRCPTSSEEPERSEVINGLNFAVSRFGGGAAGSEIQRTGYRIVHSDLCYEIDISVTWGNLGNYDPGTIRDFDLNHTRDLLKEVLETFRFVN